MQKITKSSDFGSAPLIVDATEDVVMVGATEGVVMVEATEDVVMVCPARNMSRIWYFFGK